jgi:hypothetical protein
MSELVNELGSVISYNTSKKAQEWVPQHTTPWPSFIL